MNSLYILLCLLLVAPRVDASETPENFCQRFFLALDSEGFIAAPKFFHSEEIARFKAMLIPIFEQDGAPNHKKLFHDFFGADATAETVKAISPEKFMYALMSVVNQRNWKPGTRFSSTKLNWFSKGGEYISRCCTNV